MSRRIRGRGRLQLGDLRRSEVCTLVGLAGIVDRGDLASAGTPVGTAVCSDGRSSAARRDRQVEVREVLRGRA